MIKHKALHVCLFLLLAIALTASGKVVVKRKCHHCNLELPLDSNFTDVMEKGCPVKQCKCNTLCYSEVYIKPNKSHRIHSYCGFQERLCGENGRQLIDLHLQEEINGVCKDPYHTDRGYSYKCMCGHDACNNYSLVAGILQVETTVSPEVTQHDDQDDSDTRSVIIGCSVGALLLVLALVTCVCLRRWHRRLKDEEFECKVTTGSRLSSDDASLIDGGWDESGKHSFSTYKYSSSVATQYTRGSRGNALNHNDNHLPIELQKIIGRGRYAEVWKAKLQQEDSAPQVVSVKMFRLRNYGAWRQEKDMLAERWMKHENLIEFYASEQHTVRGRLQYWLVTAYYQQGSLAEYLRSSQVSWAQFCDMAVSIAKGLSYLHAENDDSGRHKLPIAHRDVKSSNILVKDDCSSCVLADFGLSIKLDPEMKMDELSNAGQVGTSRYMAPELLERLVNLTDIEMFKRIDVYAAALVLWEIANRCEYSPGKASKRYVPPFGERITDHPTKTQMLLLVCRERQKPAIPEKWKTHTGLSFFITLLNEAWDYEPEARITAGCIFERLVQMRDAHHVTTEPSDDVSDDFKPTEKEMEANEINDVVSTVI